jgi:antitoxin HicB
MAMKNYKIAVTALSDEDGGGFIATVADLPGCMSEGDTPEEAEHNVRDAIVAWIATAKAMGREIPQNSREYA